MAFLEDLFSGWGTPALVGLGVVVGAPLLLPVVGLVVRPVAKGLIKTSLAVGDALQGMVTEGSEQFSELVAEARAEHGGRAPRRK